MKSRIAFGRVAVVLAGLVPLGCSSGGDDPNDPPPPPEIASGAYLPDDGLIVIELESGAAAGSWTEETALAGYTGASYLRWTGPNLFNVPATDAFGFDIWIEEAGVYDFRIHNRHDDPDSTMSNDCWVRMDDGEWVKVFSSQRGQWTWRTNHEFGPNDKPAAEYDLARGNHRIEFSGRSFDFSIDRFHLYDDGVVDPLNTAHPESSRFGVSAATSPPSRTLVVGPVVARVDADDDRLGRWDRAIGGVSDERALDVAVVGPEPDWSVDLDPRYLDGALDEQLRVLAARWQDRPELRWTFEASSSVVPATLDALARRVRAGDPLLRPLVLRITPDELVRRWPEVQHSVFDAVELLAEGDETRTALDLLRRSAQPMRAEVQAVGSRAPDFE